MPTPPSPLSFADAPGSPGGEAVRARLARRDPNDWPWILAELRTIAAGLAPSFRDVCSEDDVLGELALRAHERWLEDWLAAPSVPPRLFLRDRLRDHLRELRRQRQRRASLLSGVLPGEPTVETDAGHHGALFSSPPPRPDEALEAAQLGREVARVSGAPSQILDLRAAGYDQHEIAERTGASRPTVGRRLAAMAAVMAALATTGALLGAHRWAERSELHVVPIAELQTLPGAPPAPSPPAPSPPAPTADTQTPPQPPSEAPAPVAPTRVDEALHEPSVPPTEDGDERADDGTDESADDRADESAPRGLEPSVAVRRALGEEAPQPSPGRPGHSPSRAASFPSAARAARWLAPLEQCRRQEGGTISVELPPGRPPFVTVRGVDAACVRAVALRDVEAYPPTGIERLHFAVVVNRRVEARASAPLPGVQSDPMALEEEARICLANGDYACVIRLLGQGRARSARQLAMLAQAQRTLTGMPSACDTIGSLLERFPASPEASRYRTLHVAHCQGR